MKKVLLIILLFFVFAVHTEAVSSVTVKRGRVRIQAARSTANIAFSASSTLPGAVNLTASTATVTTFGTNRILFVSDIGDVPNQRGLITPSVSYNGVQATLVAEVEPADGADRRLFLWVLMNPALGANLLSVTSTATTDMFPSQVSFSGVSQVGQPEVTSTNTCTSCTSITTSLNVSSTKSWTILRRRTFNTSSPGAGTSGNYDSGGPRGRGAESMTITQTSGSQNDMSTIMASFAPANLSNVVSGKVTIKGR